MENISMTQVLICAAGLALSTTIGSILGFFIKEVPHKWNDAILGYCAGVMLAASTIGLIVPAAESAGPGKWWLVLGGVIAGMLFLNVLDVFIPHMHRIAGLDSEEHINNAHLNNVLLFVMAIALHKLPEGIAAGVGFNSEETSDAWAVAFGIALQNIPEGMVVIAPLIIAGVSKMRTFLISLAIAMLEVVGVMIGYGIGAISRILLPVMLAMAGGAMLYVVSDEMIPETHAHGHQKLATYSLILGFVTLVFMETGL
ncbi:MAG: ZIP family metal transporter [Candidatus Cryptobacteroides sp.]|nr:ZIP family metal transporter [Bacteroidales bacterium]MDY5318126.1 ZIP family metal transporter [Candidatus Cryptobacteroides sp.]